MPQRTIDIYTDAAITSDIASMAWNPADCKSARKFRCSVNNEWGFGSGVHDLLWCFVAALQTGRTLILDTSKWHYTPSGNWSTFFQPVAGPSCDGVHIDKETIIFMPGQRSRTETRRRILDLPTSIIRTLVANHAEPYAWWCGLIVSYILRLQNSTQQKIENFKKKIGYKRPIVSLHIRRTDKDGEAAHHNVNEYMHHAEEFYSALALRGETVEKRVFVATDEPSVIDEIKFRFPSFVIIANKHASTEASWLDTRYGISALENVIIDVNLLAESDRLVCAFSSGFCRVAYQLMQARHAKAGFDATRKAVSIDVEYFYAFVSFPPRRTLYENSVVTANEINWTRPGVLLEKMHDLVALHEAKEKKYADGFSAILPEGSKKSGLS
ncbi:alpha-(1,6)-fucosyltransferase [Dermacentor silvarum]|uniref:alpha-(1,6)-fucosyltransferase n=1 Tax=Dermacentor silvarum TaxID=543639 RepID=UPI00189B13A2|nr:alpha-(1,6)-fucosyltransferase [Dermacentor silvarum]